jgi:ubiquinone/menaquinone biosynthesis C-methylase UbiE
VTAAAQWQLTREAAEAYERVVARYILGPWAPSLVEAARLAQGERVLDLACGTGVVARVAAERVGPRGRVIGIDLNPGMIAVARTLPAPAGAPVEWIERNALDLGLADAGLDAVLCQQGLQFFPDKPRAMREMHRVLRPGGRVALAVWTGAGRYNAAVGEALAKFVSEDVAARFCASRRAPSRDELEQLAAGAGLDHVRVGIARIDVRLPRLDRFVLEHLTATPVAPALAGAPAEARRSVGASVMEQLASYADGEGVCYPEETYVLTATKPSRTVASKGA